MQRIAFHKVQYTQRYLELKLMAGNNGTSSTEQRSRVAQSVQWLGYGLDDRGSVLSKGREFFFSPPRPDRLWGPPGLPSNEKQVLFPGSKAAAAWSWPLTSI